MAKFFVFISVAVASVALPVSLVLAQGSSNYFGANTTRDVANDVLQTRGTASETIAVIAGEIMGTLLSFLGIVFMLLIVAGGFMWMTAQGNDVKVKNAQKLIVTAVVGLIIIISAYAITSFIADSIPK